MKWFRVTEEYMDGGVRVLGDEFAVGREFQALGFVWSDGAAMLHAVVLLSNGRVAVLPAIYFEAIP